MTVASLIIGGVGLFLLGMILLTDGLTRAAGDSLSRWLASFTGGPARAVVSGAAVTALVQSSSATSVAVIGLVSAGLLSLTQAVGVVLGANLGTTATGWIVATVGLNVSLGALALPLIAVGVALRVRSKTRAASYGLAIAGFGLIFIGIGTLQEGMVALAPSVDFSRWSGDTTWHRAGLAIVGALMTVVMQSSSAAMATTITALDAGTINLSQGAALVIGQNLGTTVTAAIAAIGASAPARRTAAAHITFNLVTGIVALLVLPAMLYVVGRVVQTGGVGGGPMTLAAFHTAFNLLGVALFLPHTERFARWIIHRVPERGPVLTRHLDASVATVPAVAIEAVRRTLAETLEAILRAAHTMIEHGSWLPSARDALVPVGPALTAVQRFTATVRSSDDASPTRVRHLSILHASEHLDRLLANCQEDWHGDPRMQPVLRQAVHHLNEQLRVALEWLAVPSLPAPTDSLASTAGLLAEARRAHREAVLARTAAGQENVADALRELAAMHWIERIAYHTWRTVFHLAMAASTDSGPSSLTAEPTLAPDDETAAWRDTR